MKLIHAANTIAECLNRTEFSMKTWKWFPSKALKKLQTSHDKFLRIVDHRIRETEREFLSRKSDDQEQSLTLMEQLLTTPGLSRKDVVTLILDMLVAGIDTTSHTIGFTLYLLARNPEVQRTLQKEVDSVLANHEGPLTSKHLAQLSYLKSVVKESLKSAADKSLIFRMLPIDLIFPLTFGTARILDKDVVLSGYHVPKGYVVMALDMLRNRAEDVHRKTHR